MSDYISIVNRLRKRFSEPLPGWAAQQKMMPEGRTDSMMVERPAPHRAGGVVLLLYPIDGVLHTAFIKRPVYDGPHSGQVAFPGGRVERSDASLMHTALRETMEEVGVALKAEDVLGALSELYIPVSHTMVHPFVAFVAERPVFVPDEKEVSYMIEVSIADLQNSDNHKIMMRESKGQLKVTPYFAVRNEIIWGATAMIVCELLALLERSETF